LADILFVGPAEASNFIVSGQFSASDFAAEDQSHDSTAHILVDARECVGLNIEAGFLADFASQAIFNGFA